MNEIGHYIRALVVLPVQELAMQVAKVCKKYCTNTGLRVALLSGSTPLQQEQQQLMKYSNSHYFIIFLIIKLKLINKFVLIAILVLLYTIHHKLYILSYFYSKKNNNKKGINDMNGIYNLREYLIIYIILV